MGVSKPPCIPLRKVELAYRMLKESEAYLVLRLGSSQATTEVYREGRSIVRCSGCLLKHVQSRKGTWSRLNTYMYVEV